MRFPAFVFLPWPARPPIWIGGNGAGAVSRVLELGDGWHPMLAAAQLKPAVAALKAQAQSRGRAEPEIVVRRGVKLDDISQARSKLEAERDAGASYFILDLGRYANETEFATAAESFITKVAP